MKFTSLKNKVKGAVSYSNRRCFSANGFSLLPLALRPRLFCLAGLVIGAIINLIMYSNFTFALDPCLDSTAPCLNVSIANSISLDLKPISPTGTFAKSDTTTNTVGVITNYFAGYTLGIAASSTGVDAANLIQTAGEGDEQTVVGRISSIGTVTGVTGAGITEQEFSNANNTQYNNTWGYKVTNLNTTTSTNYLPAPTNTTSISMDTTNAANADTANNYNIAIGARVDTEVPKGSYTNTFVVQVVANPIPYEIAFNKGNAGEGGVSGLPAALNNSTMAESITLPNTKPTRAGYVFAGWCSVMPVASGSTDSCSGNIYYQDGTGSRVFPINQTSDNTNITLYAMWQEVHNITFTAGNNIDTIIVADSGNKWKPFYITNGGSYTFSNAPVGRKYAVTVVPVANHTLDSWASTSGSMANLTSPTLLTTTYNVGTVDETLTATGSQDTASYTAMRDLTIESCPAYDDETLGGINVTDLRDGKSYTVAKFGNYCYMLSNLRLDNTMDDGNGGTTARVLTSADSDITPNATYTTFTMPTEAWASADQNYYCKAIMAIKNGGYYYNWYAAKANPYQCKNPTTSINATAENDALALGSICPAGWKLPTYNDIVPAMLWGSGNNPGLVATSGGFSSGSQNYLGGYGFWWSSARGDNSTARRMIFSGTSVDRYGSDRNNGFSVRCMRSN